MRLPETLVWVALFLRQVRHTEYISPERLFLRFPPHQACFFPPYPRPAIIARPTSLGCYGRELVEITDGLGKHPQPTKDVYLSPQPHI